LPLSTNEIYYGKRLTFDVDSTTQFVSSLYVNEIDFIQVLKQKYTERDTPFIEFESNTRFYLYTINELQYIITIKDLEKGKTIKDVYNLSGFKIVGNVIDTKISERRFTREIKNISIEFEEDHVIRKDIQIKLPCMKQKYSKYTNMPDSNIGTFDMETFRDTDSNSQVYALGFSNLSMLENKNKSSTYYLNEHGKTSNEIIVKCINDMLTSKNRNHIYYTHNLGGFDLVFLLYALKATNTEKGMEYYIIKTNFRDNKILKCTVKVKTKSGYDKITFIDSYNLLPDSLDNLSKSFGSKTKKGLFPYDFVKTNTLNYVGNTPSIEYYKVKNKIISHEDYNVLYKPD